MTDEEIERRLLGTSPSDPAYEPSLTIESLLGRRGERGRPDRHRALRRRTLGLGALSLAFLLVIAVLVPLMSHTPAGIPGTTANSSPTEVQSTLTASARACTAILGGHGPEARLVGSYTTTIGSIRSKFFLFPVSPVPWPSLTADQVAVICYIDGPVPKSPLGGQPYNRSVVAIVDGQETFVMAGYQSQLPITAP